MAERRMTRSRKDANPFEVVIFDVLRIAKRASGCFEWDERHKGDRGICRSTWGLTHGTGTA